MYTCSLLCIASSNILQTKNVVDELKRAKNIQNNERYKIQNDKNILTLVKTSHNERRIHNFYVH